MRAFQRAAGGAVAFPPRGKRLAESFLDLDGGFLPDQRFERPGKAEIGLREGAVGQLFDHRHQQPDHFGPRGGDRRAGLGHLRFDRLEPGAVARLFGKQPVAAAHRLLVVERPPAVTRIDRQHQPVEEAAAVGRPVR